MRHAWSALAFLSLVVIFLVIFAGQFVYALVQVTLPVTKTVPMRYSPLLGRGGSVLLPFDLPAHRTILYAQKDAIYSVTMHGTQNIAQGVQATPDVVKLPSQIAAPGYADNPSLPPLVTPTGQLIYAGGTGLWMTDLVHTNLRTKNEFVGAEGRDKPCPYGPCSVSSRIGEQGRDKPLPLRVEIPFLNGSWYHNQPWQIATLSDNQEVTSLVLSRDASQLAWSTAPKDGQGEIQIFAGPVGSTKLVYQQAADQCPCFRVFSFWPASDALGHDTLLLTDDHGDDGLVQHGLWVFSIDKQPSVKPALVIRSDPPQGPLALSPDNTNLLYTTYEGNVPVPDDMPDALATVGYANSLVVASLQSTVPYLENMHVVLPEQQVQGNSAQYHWVMSPSFSPDGQTLVYVEFSADSQGSFTRTNALYVVQMRGSAAPTHPTLLATTAAHYLELGSWWDAHTVTVFIDHGFYALDVQRGLLAPIIQTDGYAHEIAVMS